MSSFSGQGKVCILLLNPSSHVMWDPLHSWERANTSNMKYKNDAGRHMDAEDMEDDGIQDMGDEVERLEEEFLRHGRGARPRNPSELGFGPNLDVCRNDT